MSREQTIRFLKRNPDFLDDFVAHHVNAERIEKWLSRHGKRTAANGNTNSVSPSKSTAKSLFDLQQVESIVVAKRVENDQGGLWLELAGLIASDAFASSPKVRVFAGDDDRKSTAAERCLKSQMPVREHEKDRGVSVLCVPVKGENEKSGNFVIEFYRKSPAFTTADEITVTNLASWAQLALSHKTSAMTMTKQRQLGEFLMNVVKSVFMEMISMDTLIVKIMSFAQRLVDADRASLFLVDSKTNQLYARIFDVGVGESATREIRFPVGVGIAGVVAESGATLNVRDAYADPRFNKAVDEQTGYHTRNILCMPISIRGQVIGIVQMVNKADGVFTDEDESAFEIFAVYCGLALHHAKLYDKIRRSEQKYKVALEVLSYHNSSSAEEVEAILATKCPEEDPEITE